MSLRLIPHKQHTVHTDITHLIPGSIQDIRSAVEGFSGVGSLIELAKEARQEWIIEVLAVIDYDRLSRDDKGVVRAFLQNETGYSRAQTARLIKSGLEEVADRAMRKASIGDDDITSAQAFSLFAKRHGRGVRGVGVAGVVSSVLLLVALGGAPRQELKFLNADVLSPALVDKTADEIPMKTLVNVVRDDVEYPLFVQEEHLSFVDGVAVGYERLVATTASELEQRVAERKRQRAVRSAVLGHIPETVRAVMLPQETATQTTDDVSYDYAPSEPQSVVEYVGGERSIQLGNAVIPQTENSTTQVRGTTGAQEQRENMMSDLFRRASARRASRLARVPEEERLDEPIYSAAPESSVVNGATVYASAPSVWDAVGDGRNGQVLMVVDGVPQWTFINQSNIESLPSGYISRRGGGSGRGGGGGGGGGSAGADGAQGPAGPAGPAGAAGPTLGIYDSLGTESTGDLAAGDAGGRDLYNIGLLTSSGRLIVEGDVRFNSGVILNGVNYLFPVSDGSVTGKVLKTDGAGNLSWSDDNSAVLNVTAGQGLSANGSVIRLNAALTGTSLEIIGTASGRILHAQDLLTSSGQLVVEGATTLNDEVTFGSGIIINGVTYIFPFSDASASGRVLASDGNGNLSWTEAASSVSAGQGITIDGSNLITLSATLTGTSLEIYGTASGRILHAQDQLRSSGSLIVENLSVFNAAITGTDGVFSGTLSGSDLYAAASLNASGALNVEGSAYIHGTLSGNIITGFNLTDCNGTTNKLVYNAANQRFECETDQNTDTTFSGTGSLQTFFDNRYVETAGDTMTGALIINPETGTIALEATGIISGTTLHAQDLLTSSGQLVVEGATTLNDEVTFGSGIIINGVTYIFPFSDASASGRVLASDGNGNLSWTEASGGTTTLPGQGLSADGNYLSLNAAITGTSLEILGTASGRIVHAQDALRSSGSLVVEGNAVLNSTLTIGGVTYTFPVGDGSATGKVLKTDGAGNLSWSDDNAGGGSLSAGQGLTVSSGHVFLNAALTGTSLEIYGTASGRILHAQDTLTSSGELIVEGDSYIHGTLSGNTIVGFNLTDCQGAGDKIVYNAAAQRFECGTDTDTDTNTFFSGTGALQTFFDERFVNTSGDTMTGNLIINLESGDIAIEANGTISGTTLHAQDLLTSSGQLVVEGATTLNDEVTFGSGIIINGVTYIFPFSDASASGRVLASDGNGNLSWTAAATDTTLSAGQGLTSDGTFISLNAALTGTSLEIYGTASGRILHAQDLLTSSGTLIVEGNAVLNSTLTIGGVTYTFPVGDGSATGKVLKTDGSGNLSWSDDIDNNTTYSAGQGVTIDGSNFITLSATLTGTSLEIYGTASGRILHAQDQLRSSGSLIVENLSVFNAAITGTDGVFSGTLSGSDLYAAASLNASGALNVEGSAYIHGTLSGNTITGFNLTDCNGTTNKLVYNAANQRFECETDQNTDTTFSGTGSLQTFFDNRYVETAGDTMTGALIINPETGTIALEATGIISGTTLHAQDLLTSSGTLIVEGNAVLNSTLTIGGVTYTFPVGDGSATGKVLKTDGSGNLSWSDDLNDNTTYSAGQGITIDGSNFITLSATLTGTSLEIYGTASGRILHAQDELRSSGSLIVEGATTLNDEVTFGSGIIINGVTYIFPFSDASASGRVLASDSNGNLSWTEAASSVSAGQGITIDGNNFITLSATLTGTSLEIYGTASGRIVHAQDNLTSSGTLQVDGAVEFGSTLTIGGVTYTFPVGDGTATGKVLKTDASGNLSWSTDLTSEGGGGGGSAVIQEGDVTVVQTGSTIDFNASDFDVAESPQNEANIQLSTSGLAARLDSRYVTVAGDTMSGGLLIINGGDDSSAVIDEGLSLEVAGTASGRIIHAQDALTTSGSLSVRGGDMYLEGDLTYLRFRGETLGGGGQGIVYTDSGAADRYSLFFPGDDIVVLGNRASDGVVQVRANSATPGGAGESVTAQYEDDEVNFYVTVSGTTLHAQDLLTSSGQLVVEGATTLNDEVTFGSGIIINGVTYIFPFSDASASGRVLASDGNGNLSWTAAATDTTLSAGQGLTSDGTFISLNAALTGTSLEIYGTASGRILHAQDLLTSSGTLIVEGNAVLNSTLTIGGVTYTFPVGDGSATGKVLKTDGSGNLSWSDDIDNNTTYSAGQGVTIDGSNFITLSATLTGTSLEIYGTASGRILHAQDQLRSSGSLIVENLSVFNAAITGTDGVFSGTLSGSDLYAAASLNASGALNVEGSAYIHGTLSGNTITGFNLTDCNGTTNKLVYNAANQRFECETDQNTDTTFSGTGSLQTFFDNRYVETAGDTMTGALIINPETGTIALEATGIISGTTLHAQDLLTSSGTLIVEGNAVLNSTLTIGGVTYTFPVGDGSATGKVLKTDGSGNLSWSDDLNDNTTYSAGQGITIDGNNFITLSATLTGTSLEIYGTASGRILHAQDLLTSSGQLVVEGATTLNDEVTFGSGIIINGVTYIFPFSDASASGRVLASDGNGNLSWTAAATDTTLSAGQGLTSDGTFISLNAALTGTSLEIYGTASGRIIHAQDELRSSGSLIVEGATTLNDEVTFGSGIIINGVTYIFPFSDASASGRVLASDGNGNLSWTAAATDTTLSAGQGLTTNGGFIRLNAALTGTSLEIYGTASGRIIHAQDELRSSGTLVVDGNGTSIVMSGGAIDFGGNSDLAYSDGRLFYDTDNDSLSFYNSSDESKLQIGQEQWIRVYNDAGFTIKNGSGVYQTGFNNTTGLPTIGLAKADDLTTARLMGIATHDIEDATIGYVTYQGVANGINTSEFGSGEIVWVSAQTGGLLTNQRPLAPNLAVLAGTVNYVGASTGSINIRAVEDNGGVERGAAGFYNGAFITQPNVTVSSNGSTITLSLEREGGGDTFLVFDEDFYELDTTPAATVSLNAGSDTSPQLNYIYIPKSTKVLTVSTSGFPTAEQHVPVATVVVQTASTVQTDGALKVHVWTDHVQDNSGQGHLADLNYWIRNQEATWLTGVVTSADPGIGGGTDTTIDVSTTAGTVLQLHDHTFRAFDTSGGDVLYVVNDPTTPYKQISGLVRSDLSEDSAGESLSNKSYTVVLWGIVNEDTDDQRLMINLPSGSYGKDNAALQDTDKYTNYNIPAAYRGIGFLIAEIVLDDRSAGGGTLEVIGLRDLRGINPGQAGGGTSQTVTSFADSAFEIYDNEDNTRVMQFQLDNLTTATTRTIIVPDADGTLVLLQNGTISGSTLHSQILLQSSGSLAVEEDSYLQGEVTFGSGIIINGVTYIFPFSDASASGRVLASDGNGNLSWTAAATDTTLSAGQGLTSDGTFISLNAALTGTSLEIYGTASGRILHAQDELRSSGSLIVEGNAVLNSTLTIGGVTYTFPVGDASASGRVLASDSSGNLSWTAAAADTTLSAGQGLTTNGGFIRLNAALTGTSLEIYGTASGRILHAQDELRSSGSLIVEGATTLNDEVTFGSGIIINGVTYIFPFSDASASGRVLASDSNGNLSWTEAASSVSAGQGITIDGNNFITLSATLTGTSLEIYGTASGRIVHAQDNLTSSGTLQVDGAVEFGSTLTIGGVTYTFPSSDGSASGKVLATDGSGNLSWTDGGSSDGLTQATADDRYVRVAGDTMTGGLLIHSTNDDTATIDAGVLLEISGVASGATLHAQDLFSGSGRLLIKSTLKAGSGVLTAVGAEFQSGAYLSASGGTVLALNSYTQSLTGDPHLTPHILFGYQNVFDIQLTRLSGATLGVNASILPLDDNTYELGAEDKRWTSVYAALLEAGTVSGATVHAEDILTSSGGLIVEGYTRINNTLYVNSGAVFSGNLLPVNDDHVDLGSTDRRWRDLYLGPSTIHLGSTGDEGTISYNAARSAIVISDTLEVTGTISGASITNGGSIASSGSLTIEGTATINDEVTFGSGIIINGVTYIFPFSDASASGRVLASDGNGNLSWTAAATDTTLSAGQGLTSDGTYISLNAALTGTSLEIYGTASGRILHAQDTLTSSGELVVEGAAVLNSTLTIGGVTYTFPVGDGSASGKVLATDGSGNLSWTTAATDTTLSAGQGLTSDGTFISLNAALTGTSLEIFGTISGSIIHASTALTTSGVVIAHSDGSLSTPEFTFSGDTDTGFAQGGGNTLSFVTNGTQRFKIDTVALRSDSLAGVYIPYGSGDASGPLYSFAGDQDTGMFRYAADSLGFATAGANRVIIHDAGLQVIGTSSGDIVHAVTSLSSSGTLVVEGAATLNSTVAINGVTYTFPSADGSASGKVLATDGSGNLSWTDDATGGGSLSAGQGLTSDGTFISLNAALTGTSLEIYGTASGRIIHAQDELRSSGSLLVEGNAIFQTATDSTDAFQILDADGGNPIFHADTTNERVGIGTDTPDSALHVLNKASNLTALTLESYSVGGAQVNLDFLRPGNNSWRFNASQDFTVFNSTSNFSTNTAVFKIMSGSNDYNVGIGTAAPDTKLEVIGTISGSQVYAADILRSSGALVIEGAATLNSTVAINGVTYTFPSADGSASGKVLATDGSGNLSWTDGGSSSGISQSEGDDRYVNTAGDTMTGGLTILSATNIPAFNIQTATTTDNIFTLSGSSLTTGTAFRLSDLGSLTTGTGISIVSTSEDLTSGGLFDIEHTVSSATLAKKTGAIATITSERENTGTDPFDDFDLLYLRRVNQADNTATYTTSGSVLRIENISSGSIDESNNDRTRGIELIMSTIGPNYGEGDALYIDNDNIGDSKSINVLHSGNSDAFSVSIDRTTYVDDIISLETYEEDNASFNFLKFTTDSDGTPDIEFTVDESGNIATDGTLGVGIGGDATPDTQLEVVGTISGSQLVIDSGVKQGSGAIAATAAEFQSGAYLYGSGAAVLALDSYQGTQSGTTAHIMFGYRGVFDTSLYRSGGDGGGDDPGSGGLVLKTLQKGADQSAFEIITDYGSEHNRVFRVTASGAVHADGAFNSTGADYAEWFKSRDALENGEVVCIDVSANNTIRRCTNEADSNVMGIVSSNPAFIGNVISGAEGIIPPGYELIGLIGQVPTKVRIEERQNGSGTQLLTIRPGDALTPSVVPGFTRRALPGEPTVGVALEGFDGVAGDEGSVNVLISRRNSSLTVDMVEKEVIDQIASMQIEDEVRIMVAQAVDSIELDDEIAEHVRSELDELDINASIRDLLGEWNITEQVTDVLESLRNASGSVIGTTLTDDQRTQVESLLSSGSVLWGRYDSLSHRIAMVQTEIYALSGALTGRDGSFDSVAIEDNLVIGGDARAASDFYVDGTLHAEDIFVPGMFTLDGSMDVRGSLSAGELTVQSGAVIHGPLTIDGKLMVDGKELDLSGLAGSGGFLNLGNLLVQNALKVLGDITIDGMAEILGDVSIGGDLTLSGSLTVNKNQAGYAVIVKTGTGVDVRFGSGTFTSVPLVTASSDSFAAWRITKTFGTGFTIEVQEPAEEDIRFAWHALLTEDPHTFKGLPAGAGANDKAFYVDASGVPLSSSDIWNACIRNQQPLDINGQPFNCRRYRDDGDLWTHPDHLVQFKWDPDADTDVRLIVPKGYYVEVVGEEEVEQRDEPNLKGEQETEEETDMQTGTGETVIEDEPSTGTGETVIEDEVETGTGDTVIEDEPSTGTGETVIENEVETGTGETVIEDEPSAGTGETIIEESSSSASEEVSSESTSSSASSEQSSEEADPSSEESSASSTESVSSQATETETSEQASSAVSSAQAQQESSVSEAETTEE